MNTERQTSVAYTDKERIKQFLVYLPEVSVRDFAYQISIFPHYYKDFAFAYSEYRRNIQESSVFIFTDPKTQEAFLAFNTAIDTLYAFSLACLSSQYPGDPLLDEIYRPEGYLEVVPPNNIKEAQDRLNTLAKTFLDAYLSLLKTTTEEIKKKEASESGSEIPKNKKRVTLLRFPRTEWPNVSIRFLSDRDVILSDSKEHKPADFQSLGFADGRTGNPDLAWELLLEIAKNVGESDPVPQEERDRRAQHKHRLTDALRTMFSNQTDPFDDFFQTKTYRALFEIIPPSTDIEADPIYSDD